MNSFKSIRNVAVFTDLDGTLLDEKTYSFEAARPALAALREKGCLLVPCTSKTSEETFPLLDELGGRDPFIVENGGAAGNHGGSYRVPTVGTMVTVFFEGNDPNKPYWLPFSPTVNGDIIAGTNLGKGTNVENAAANWQDPAKRTKIHVLAEHDNGNIIYLDSNADNNAFVIRWANGHTLSIGHAAESGIILQTEKGHMVQLDENSQEIRLRTHTGKVSLVMSDATGDVTITNTGKTTVNSIGATLVKSAASVTIQAPKISLKG